MTTDSTYVPVHLALRTRSVGLESRVDLLVNDRSFATLPVDTTIPAVAEWVALQALGEVLAALVLRAEDHAEPTYLDPR